MPRTPPTPSPSPASRASHGCAPSHHDALQVPITYEGITVVTPEFVARAHANGLTVHVWTINDRATMEWLIDIGVDGIMTDKPTLLEEILEARGIDIS